MLYMYKNTLVQLILNSIKNFDNNSDIIFVKKDNKYSGINRISLLNKVFQLKSYFKNLNINKGDKIAIISENRTEWVITDMACIISGIIDVPLYTSLSKESVKYILKNSGVVACFVSNNLIFEKVISVKNELPELKYIICYNDIDHKFFDSNVQYFSEIMKNETNLNPESITKELEICLRERNEEDVLTIIYTSGTTGTPKGVMLTQKNIYANVISCTKTLPINEQDVFLSYLPYSHIYERTAGYYLAFFTGAKIYYAQSIDTIGIQMPEVKPTIVITVPRLLDKMYHRLMKSADEMPHGYKKRLMLYAIFYAKAYHDKNKSVRWKFLDKLVYGKIRERTGGRLRFFVSGGGALNKSIGEFFDCIGIMTLEGYGMTETSPVISVNLHDYNIYGTEGRPLSGNEVKIAEDGEILVKGDLVMKGYYEDEEETRRAVVDGWMHTGDLGEWVEKNHFKITDRKKSLFKSSGGKYIAPTYIEDLILQIPYIDQVLVIGNERMYVTALIVPEFNELKSFAQKLGLQILSDKDLLANQILLKEIEKDINIYLKDLSSFEKIRKFILLEKPFTIEDGELTPTLKIKRKFVEEKYKHIIDAMYHKV